MSINFGTKNCAECKELIECKIQRDVIRKKFCSRKCLGIYTEKMRPEDKKIKNFQHLACTPEANVKKSHKGEKHPLYKKDRTKVLSKRPRYELTQWTKQVFERDNYTCQHCFERGGQLQADHIKSYVEHPELRWDLSNGRTLCIDCHKETDTYGIKMYHKLKKQGFYAKSQ